MTLQVSVNGQLVDHLLRADLTCTNFFSADSFSLVFSLSRDPIGSLNFWLELSRPFVEVDYFEADAAAPVRLISGMVDSMTANPILNTISMEGRDLSARLIDSILQRDFVNQTASEIVETIAVEHSLIPNVTSTAGNVGRCFSDGFTRLSLGQFSQIRSSWDLLVKLAREQHFDLFVRDMALFFQPVANALDSVCPITIDEVISLRIEKNLMLEAAPSVTVQSWNSQQRSSYRTALADSQTGPVVETDRASSSAFLFAKSNLTLIQAQSLVTQYVTEISRHKTSLYIEMPWDVNISARSLILLLGTSSPIDGLYHVDSVERQFASSTGSVQLVKAVSWSIDS